LKNLQKRAELFGILEKYAFLYTVKRGFRRKDDNLYDPSGRFEPFSFLIIS